jgi:hypothetical protein
MKRTIMAIIAAVLSSTAGYSQQQNSADIQQILQLLQGINNKFDVIDKRLDNLEKLSQPGANAAASNATAATPKPQTGVLAVPGWKVEVRPYDGDILRPDPIARAKVPIGKVNFDLHFGDGPTAALVAYHGEAYFRVKEGGKYTFKTFISASEVFECNQELYIDKNKISDANVSGISNTTGSVELNSGDYLLNYTIGCVKNTKVTHIGSSGTPEDQVINGYRKSFFDIRVLGPNDPQFREFKNDELFFVEKPNL